MASMKMVLATIAMLGLVASAHAQTYELRFATSVANVEEPSYKAMASFAERVEERSGGRIDITIFHGEQLGAQKKVNEMIMGGAALMNMTDYGQLGQFSPDLGLVAGPYVFGSLGDAERLFASDVFAEMSDKLAQQGIRIIMPDGLFGYRHMIADRPIRTPADVEGMTVRVPPSPILLEAFRALGARPTEVPWGEVYNALQSNVVNAAEAPFASIYGSKLNEVRKVVSRTGHQIMFTAWVISSSFFDNLPADLQQILLEEGDRIADELTAATLEGDAHFADLLVQSGVEIIDDVDVAAFQELTRKAYDSVPNLTPGILDRIRAAMKAD